MRKMQLLQQHLPWHLGLCLDDIVQGLEQAIGAKGRLNFIQHQTKSLIH